MNVGKKFEELIQDSCKVAGVDCTRLKDAGWQGETTQRRFTSKNICDFMLFDGERLAFAEAKTSKGDSITFDRLTQQKELMKKKESARLSNLHYGYLLEFRKSNKYFYISAYSVYRLQQSLDKKSFNVKDLEYYKAYGVVRCINTYLPPRKRNNRLDMGFLDKI